MQVTFERVLNTGRRVHDFVTAQAPTLGTTVPGPLLGQLGDAVGSLGAAQVAEETLAQAASAEIARQDAIRQGLSADFLIPIGRIVRRAYPKNPDFQALIVSAKLTRKSQFVAKVTSAATVAAAHADELIGKGMPADFVAQMQAGVAQLTASVATRNKQVADKTGTVETIQQSVKVIRDVVHIIDGNMRRALKQNPALLQNWNATKKVPATVVTPLPGGDLDAASAGAEPVAPVTTPSATPAA
jgi:hypothetical protein